MKKLHLLISFASIFCLTCKDDESTLGPGQFKDIDGNIYNSVVIGNQTWMLENLNVTKFRNGDPVPEVKDKQDWINSKNSPAHCIYENSISTPKIYGKLYNNKVATDTRNIAPEGWRVSNLDDIAKLRDFVRNNNLTGYALLNNSAEWGTNTAGFNSLGFSAYPSGYRSNTGDFVNSLVNPVNTFIFWTNSIYEANYSTYAFAVKPATGEIVLGVFEYSQGFAIRCIKD